MIRAWLWLIVNAIAFACIFAGPTGVVMGCIMVSIGWVIRKGWRDA